MPFLLIPVVALAIGLYLAAHKKAQENALQQASAAAATSAAVAAAAPVTPGGVVAAAAAPAAPVKLPVGGLFGGAIVPQKAPPTPSAPSAMPVSLGGVVSTAVAVKIGNAARSLIIAQPIRFTDDPYGLNRQITVAALGYLVQNPTLAVLQQTESQLNALLSPESQSVAQTLHGLFNL